MNKWNIKWMSEWMNLMNEWMNEEFYKYLIEWSVASSYNFEFSGYYRAWHGQRLLYIAVRAHSHTRWFMIAIHLVIVIIIIWISIKFYLLLSALFMIITFFPLNFDNSHHYLWGVWLHSRAYLSPSPPHPID